MKKIALIGMPGSGKSTIGEIISKKLNYKYIDLDEYIEKKEKKTIKELFAIGEKEFRDAETNALLDVEKIKENLILATGGGIIIKQENIEILSKEFIIIFINRPLNKIKSDINSESRPLLANGEDILDKLYRERYNIYKNVCNIEVLNEENLENICEKILSEINV